jgi:phytoene dehydrogenase-like protein
MADATYDVIIVGGGNKGLILAMYLAKYGGMDVAIFEKRHEAGGGWCTDEGPAPGFLADYHASATDASYHMPLEWDFPEWVELGGRYIDFTVGHGAIFKEDDSCIVTYTYKTDPNYERTAKSIAGHSERDAETWVGLQASLRKFYFPALVEFMYNPPPPPGVPDAMERLMRQPDTGFDPVWAIKSLLEAARDVFESDAVISMLMRLVLSALGIAPDVSGGGLLPFLLALAVAAPRRKGGASGGTHSWAHAATKIFLANGGKIFTKQEVDRVLIENGKAKGVRLADGTEIEARRLVVSTLDPYNLCFRLIGKEHLNWQILRRVESLERRNTTITWYTWALHELPNYKAAGINPDINKLTYLALINKDPEAQVREHAMRKLGRMPEELQLFIITHSLGDRTRVPEGKYSLLTEQYVLPANALTEREWIEFKSHHARQTIELFQRHASNMSWDNVIGYMPLTPYDHCKLANMAPTGNWAIIDNIPSQFGRLRPIPELASYRTPIGNLYATGSAWHPYGGGGSWQGYNAYKVIAEDFGLEKPWEGRPF